MVAAPSEIPSRDASVLAAGPSGVSHTDGAPGWLDDHCRSLTQTMIDGFVYCRMLYDEGGRPADWTYLAVNPAFVSLTGLEDVVGRRATEAIPGIRDSCPELFEIYGRVASGGPPERFEIYFTPFARWLSIAVSSPDPGHFVAVFEDITSRKQIEADLRLFRRSLDCSGDMIHWIAPDGRLIYANESSARRFGGTREELLSLTVFDLDPSMTREAWPAHWQQLKTRGSLVFESVHTTRDGEIYPIEVTANYLECDGNEYNFGFARDITARRTLESSLRLTQLSVDRAADLIHWIAPDGRLLYVSDSNCLRHGYSRDELLGMTIFDLDPVLTRTVWEQQWQQMKELGSISFETVHRTKAWEMFPVEVTANYVRQDDREYNFVFARDISERKKVEQDLRRAKAVLEAQNREQKQVALRLQEANRELLAARDALTLQARTDPLTGFLNRGAVLSRLEEELERARRGLGSLAVAMIDIDHFKKINDTHGHPVGDQVLCEVAGRCFSNLRPYDVFGRFGGDEFLVVIHAADEDEARGAFERIREAIVARPAEVDAKQIPVAVSIGGVLCSEGSAAELIRVADEALYQAKGLGRDRLVMRGAGSDARAAAPASSAVGRGEPSAW